MKWTDKQLDIINTRNRNILVSAAAGSGKTAVLVERIVSLITDERENIDVDQLLVLTFTRAAASEMKERLRERLEELQESNNNDNIVKQLALLNNATITTIDSFCGKVVKENFDKIDLDPNYRIAEEIEVELMKNDILNNILEEYYEEGSEEFLELARKYSGGKVNDRIFNIVDTIYKKAKGEINPILWVNNLKNKYKFNNLDDILNGEVYGHVFKSTVDQLNKCREDLQKAIEISEMNDDLKSFGQNSKDMLVEIDYLLEQKDFKSLAKYYEKLTLPRLSTVRKGNPELKLKVKTINSSVKATVEKLKDLYFTEPIDEIYEDLVNCRETIDILCEITIKLIERFTAEKREKRIADFDDIAHMALNILNDIDGNGKLQPTKVAKDMSKNYKEIMIDEYQDSNYVQEAILTSVSKGYGINNMFMVGDVKQSIYRFRNAKPQLFLEKFYSYEEDLQADNCLITLDQNFRSRKEIIDSVNFLFDRIMTPNFGDIDYQKGHRLSLGAQYEKIPERQDNRTEFIGIQTGSKEKEATFVASKIRELTDPQNGFMVQGKDGKMRPAQYKDIVILMRSVKSNAGIYVEQLMNMGIPAYADSKSGFFDSMEVETIMNMLTIIDNPRQDIPLVSVLTSAMFNFTDDELAVIKGDSRKISFLDSLLAYQETGDDSNLVKKIYDFFKELNYYRKLDYKNSVYEIINEILERTGFQYYVSALSNGKRRYLNIESLKEKAANYEKTSYRGLFNFVRYIEKIKELDSDQGEASTVNENDNIVRILSIHKSKGLQFPIVFICDTSSNFVADAGTVDISDNGYAAVDAIFPDVKLTVTPTYRKYVKDLNKQESRMEYLRLLYVALTRAKEKLIITGRVGSKYEKECEEVINSEDAPLTYNQIMNNSSFFKWMRFVYLKNQVLVNNSFVTEDEISENEVDQMVKSELKKMLLETWNNAEVPKDVYDRLIKDFNFEYPYIEDINLCSKASVTELKKESMADEEAEDSLDKIFEKTSVHKETEIVPQFMKEDKESSDRIYGAERGTAYHRVFELMDIENKEYSKDIITNMIQAQIDSKLLTKIQGEAVNPYDILKFTKTKVFERMAKAKESNQLYRERQFLLGVQAKEIKEHSNSDELMIIQGIIDVCFIEDDRYVILDYKTDNVDSMDELKHRYKKQLECYKLALEKITGKKVSEMIIYSVKLGEEMAI